MTINAHLSQMNETPMKNIELQASTNPPQNTEFKLWAYGKCKPHAEIEAEGEIGASYKVTVSKKNIQADADFPPRLNLDYTMKMFFLPPGKKLKIRLVFTEEDEHSLQGCGKVLEVNPE